LIDATGVPFQRQLPGLAGFDPLRSDTNGSFPEGKFSTAHLPACVNRTT
jgi:hypothetical protein